MEDNLKTDDKVIVLSKRSCFNGMIGQIINPNNGMGTCTVVFPDYKGYGYNDEFAFMYDEILKVKVDE